MFSSFSEVMVAAEESMDDETASMSAVTGSSEAEEMDWIEGELEEEEAKKKEEEEKEVEVQPRLF